MRVRSNVAPLVHACFDVRRAIAGMLDARNTRLAQVSGENSAEKVPKSTLAPRASPRPYSRWWYIRWLRGLISRRWAIVAYISSDYRKYWRDNNWGIITVFYHLCCTRQVFRGSRGVWRIADLSLQYKVRKMSKIKLKKTLEVSIMR